MRGAYPYTGPKNAFQIDRPRVRRGSEMASLADLKKDRRIALFALKGKLTGKLLGDGCYGPTEEVSNNNIFVVEVTRSFYTRSANRFYISR